MNYEKNQSDSQKNIENKDVIKNDSQSDSQKNLVTHHREKLLKLMKHNSNITSKDLIKILNVSSSTVNRDLVWLRKNNFIEYAGSSKSC